ncbi:putative rfbS protein [Vibrio cholerae]|nr:putative rfbS protein [Vibrio cholerae]
MFNLLKGETTFKGGIKHKRMKFAMDESHLTQVLRYGDIHAVFVLVTLKLADESEIVV